MGARGPAPKRPETRRRRNGVEGEDSVQMIGEVVPPELPARPLLHELAKAWYEALKLSGESFWYEPSDWEEARIHAVLVSKLLRSRKVSGELLGQLLKSGDRLGTTDSARRRNHRFVVRVLADGKDEGADKVSSIRERYKSKLTESDEASPAQESPA